jgi:hypothetical protein
MTYSKGDRVRWNAGNESSVSTVRREIISSTEAGRGRVRASKDEPEYLAKSEKTGKTPVHHPDRIAKA